MESPPPRFLSGVYCCWLRSTPAIVVPEEGVGTSPVEVRKTPSLFVEFALVETGLRARQDF